MLSDCVWRVCRNANNVYFAIRMPEIHVVISRTTQCDGFYSEGAELVYNCGICGIVDKNTNTVVSVRELGCVLVELCLEIFEFHACGVAKFVKSRLVVAFCIKKCEFDIKSTPFFDIVARQ